MPDVGKIVLVVAEHLAEVARRAGFETVFFKVVKGETSDEIGVGVFIGGRSQYSLLEVLDCGVVKMTNGPHGRLARWELGDPGSLASISEVITKLMHE